MTGRHLAGAAVPLTLLTILTFLTSLLTGCNEPPRQHAADNWIAQGDTGPTVDAGAHPDAARRDTTNQDTSLPDTRSTDTGSPDTGSPDTSGTRDTGSPDTPAPDTGPTRWRGHDYQGPKVDGDLEIGLRKPSWGVGLYWQTALDEFSHGPHRWAPTRPVLNLAQVDGKLGTRDFEWHLPKTLPDDLHYYHNYCKKVGDGPCKKRGIDKKASIALVMVGVHEAPPKSKPGDCTYGMIYGKNRCDFGRSIAPSQRLFLFVYRDLQANDVPILAKIGLGGSLKMGWYHFLPRQPVNVLRLDDDYMAPIARFDSRQMFPMLP